MIDTPREVGDLVPYPATEGEATPGAMLRHIAAIAHGDAAIADIFYDRAVQMTGTRAGDIAWQVYGMNRDLMRTGWAVGYLLATLMDVDPERATTAAASIWFGWDRADRLPDMLRTLLADFGIDPDKVAEIARAQVTATAVPDQDHPAAQAGKRHLEVVRDV